MTIWHRSPFLFYPTHDLLIDWRVVNEKEDAIYVSHSFKRVTYDSIWAVSHIYEIYFMGSMFGNGAPPPSPPKK